jgi:hypothetical protein
MIKKGVTGWIFSNGKFVFSERHIFSLLLVCFPPLLALIMTETFNPRIIGWIPSYIFLNSYQLMQLSRRYSCVQGFFSFSTGGNQYDLLTTPLGISTGGICGGGKGNFFIFFFVLCKAVYPTGVPERPLLGKIK